MSIEKPKNILGKPPVVQITHRKAILKDLTGKSLNMLAVEAGVSNGTADDWTDKQIEKPSRTVSDFLSHHKISENWWKSGEGEVFITPASNSSGSKEIQKSPRETFYEDLMERNKDYFVAPRAIFSDYKIVPDKIIDVIISSTDEARKALERSKDLEIESLVTKHETIIQGLEMEINALRKENSELRRQIPGQ